MSTLGSYGLNIPSSVNPDDVEIYYTYRPTLSSTDDDNLKYKELNPNILTKAYRDNDSGNRADEILEGMYNLQLPLSDFNRKGFYTVYIKPREIRAVIASMGTLSSFQDVRGMVIDTSKIDTQDRFKFLTNNQLVGYRVIYLNPMDGSREDYYRIVTSNNRCEPLTQNLMNSNEKITTYRYNDSSSLTFITLTPSVAPTFKANAIPFIGNTSQEVIFVNTKFEPIMIEIEMVDHDADTITNMIEGSQLRDLEGGLVTTFNENNEIYHQSEHYTLKDTYTGKPIYEVKKNKKNSIDFSQNIDDK